MKGRVLVVDDDEQITELLRLVVGRSHVCEIAHDATTAMRLVIDRDFDVVLIDIGLPGGSGLQLIDDILAATPRTAIVMVTGESDPATAAAAAEMGAYGYVIKPFSINEIIIAVDNALHRKRLEDANREMVAQLHELDDAKNALLTSVSHDLRSPLAGIVGFAHLLEKQLDRLPPDKVRVILADIGEAAKRMVRMLQDLLDSDRLSRGVVARRTTDVGALVHEVADSIDLRDHRLHLDCNVDKAVVDAAMVERIIENLIANAVKHTPVGTDIWVTAARLADGIELTVADAGTGISDELKPVILERYRRGDTEVVGSGIGLSLVRKFAVLHGGEVAVEDRPGGGVLFRVALPEMETGETNVA